MSSATSASSASSDSSSTTASSATGTSVSLSTSGVTSTTTSADPPANDDLTVSSQPESEVGKPGAHHSGLAEPKGIFQKAFRKWTAFIAHHPYIVAGVSLFMIFAMSGIAFAVVPFDQGGGNGAGNFMALGEKWVEEALVFQAMLRAGQDTNFTTRSDTLDRLSLSYRVVDEDKSIFTPDGLREFKAAEDRILAVEGFDEFCQLVGGACLPPLSPTSIFFNATTGALLYDTQTEIDDFIESLKTADGNAFDPSVSFFFPAVTLNGTDQGPGMRALYFFGGPLEGYSSVNDRVEEQREELLDIMTAIEDEILLMNEEYEDASPSDTFRLEVLYLGTVITNNEFVRIINNDFLLASVAGIMVYAFLCLFSWSIFLSTLGLFHIVMSFPTAYFFYTIVAQFRITPSLNLLSLFIILGIGADDVFVYLDAWKQSGKEGPGITADLATRVHWTYRRAVGAMFVTSFTTFVAFLGTAFTPLPAMAAFGWMAALVILTNFIWVCSWFPALVVIWDKYLAHKCCYRSVETNRLAKTTTGGMSEISNYRTIERFYYTHVTNWVYALRWFILIFFFFVMVAAIVGATYLEEPDAPPDDLPERAQLSVATNFGLDNFPASAESNLINLKMVWGRLAEYVLIDDRGEKVDRLSQETTGTTLVDENINVATPAAQQYVLDMCDWVEARTCSGCPEDQIDNTNLVLPLGNECVMRAFRDWVVNVDNGTFPVAEAAFVGKVEAFYEHNQNDESELINWSSLNAIGIETDSDGSKRAVHIYVNFATKIAWTSSNYDARDWYEVWDDVIRNDDLRGFETPEEMQWGFQTLGFDFSIPVSYAWVQTFAALERSVYQTLFVSIGLAFLILNLTTLNLFISTIAIVAITTIVAIILSTMVVIGWTLTYVEAISTMMLVGLAVDYTVHFANSYNEAGDVADLSTAENRRRRVRIALTEMGISVLGGSATTLSSAAVLLFAVLPFFSQFGAFIFITIITAFIVSHTYFQAMLLVFGPVGNWGSWSYIVSCGKVKTAHGAPSSPAKANKNNGNNV